MKNLSPEEVFTLLKEGSITLIDVREPDEYAKARIEGAVLAPLSALTGKNLPDSHGKPIVFHCAGGVRSAKAFEKCAAAGVVCEAHMAGGINAWIKAGLPVVSG